MVHSTPDMLTCLELAKQCLLKPDGTLHKNKSVSKDLLVAELDNDIRECLV